MDTLENPVNELPNSANTQESFVLEALNSRNTKEMSKI